MDAWGYQHGIQLDFIRPKRPVENGFIETFDGRLRDEWLNVEVFIPLEDVRDKLACWQKDYNLPRPDSTLQDQASVSFIADWLATIRTPLDSHELLEALNVSHARFATPHKRPKPITHRPHPQISVGLHSRGKSKFGVRGLNRSAYNWRQITLAERLAIAFKLQHIRE
jgi:hypothetical protein